MAKSSQTGPASGSGYVRWEDMTVIDHGTTNDELRFLVEYADKSRKDEWKLHDDFTGVVWEKLKQAYWNRRFAAQTKAIGDEEDKEYTVERIIWHMEDPDPKLGTRYLVRYAPIHLLACEAESYNRWSGWTHIWDSWHLTRDLENAKEALSAYKERRRRVDHRREQAARKAEKSARKAQEEASSEEQPAKRRKVDSSAEASTSKGMGKTKLQSTVKRASRRLVPHEPALSTMREPKRTRKWLKQTYQSQPGAIVVQSELWQARIEAFGLELNDRSMEPTELFNLIHELFPLCEAKEWPDGSKNFVFTGISAKEELKKEASASPKSFYRESSDVSKPSKEALRKAVAPSKGKPSRYNKLRVESNVELEIDIDDDKSVMSVARSVTTSEMGLRRSKRLSEPSEELSTPSTDVSKLSLQRRIAALDSEEAEDIKPHTDVFAPFSESDFAQLMRKDKQDWLNKQIAIHEAGASPTFLYHAKEEGYLEPIAELVKHCAPTCEFEYTSKMVYDSEIDPPKKKSGCGCIGRCQDNKSCLCWKRQKAIIEAVANSSQTTDYAKSLLKDLPGGLAYDSSGLLRLRAGDNVPVVECDEHCGCSPDCHNRQLQRGRGPDLKLDLVYSDKGWGVHLAQDAAPLQAGQVVFSYAGELITREEASRRAGAASDLNKANYLFDLDFREIQTREVQEIMQAVRISDSDTVTAPSSAPADPRDDLQQGLYSVDAANKGNLSRYVNHSCFPNMYLRAVYNTDVDVYRPHLTFFAHRAIQPGDELCISYKGDAALIEYDQTGKMTMPKKSRGRAGRRRRKGSEYYEKCKCGAVNCDTRMFEMTA